MGLAFPRHGLRPELHWKHGKNDTSAKNIHSCPNDQLANTRGGAHWEMDTSLIGNHEPGQLCTYLDLPTGNGGRQYQWINLAFKHPDG